MAMARDLVLELKGHEVRHEDIICLNDRGGDAFLVFFSPKRRDGPAEDRRPARRPRSASRATSTASCCAWRAPYLGSLRRVTVGFALAFYNPLVMPERLVSRLVEEAWGCVRVLRAQRDLQNRCDLQEVLLADQLSTVFQPVVELRRRRVLGYEALSRGPAGSVYQMPLRLFEMAARGGPRLRARPQVPPPGPDLGGLAARGGQAVRQRVSLGDVRPRVPGRRPRAPGRGPGAHPRPGGSRDHREVGDRELRASSWRRSPS